MGENDKDGKKSHDIGSDFLNVTQISGLHLQTLFNAIDESVFLLDRDGTVLAGNNVFAARLGKTVAECLGKNIYDMIPSSVAKSRRVYMDQVFATGKPVSFQDKRRNRWIHQNLYPAVEEDGTVSSVAVFAIDITERKLAEEALKRSEALLRKTQSLGNVGGWEWDVEKQSMFWTEETYNIHDLEVGKIVPGSAEHVAHSLECYLPDDRPIVLAAFENCAEKGQPYDLELHFRTTKDRQLRIRTAAEPVFEKGKIVRVIGTIVDITERKLAEEALKESAALRQSVMDAIDALIYIADMQTGELLFVNEYGRREWGRDIVGMKCWKALQGFDSPCSFCKNDRLLNDDGSIAGVYRWEHQNMINGQWYDLRDCAVQWTDGRLVKMEIATNITERKLTEEAVRTERDMAQKYLDMAGVMFVVLDHSGNVTLINRKGCDLLGFSSADILGKNWLDHFIPGSMGGEMRNVFQRIVSGELENLEFYENTVLTAAGHERMIAWHNTLLHDEKGEFSGVLSAGEDITDRKIAEEKIRFMSFHDQLTGLYNRHYLESEMARLDTQRQMPLSMIMADLNGLKLINDTYGHSRGDELIKCVSEILQMVCRTEDISSRWGGDEFIVLLPQTTTAEAEAICKRIKAGCTEASIDGVPVSIALGVASKDDESKSLIEVLREAEDNMYRQKLTESHSNKNAVLQALLKTLAAKSFETETHTRGMQQIAQQIGQKLNLPDAELSRLDLLITLHDIGKINIAEEILTKKGALTEEEWDTIKKHPEIGFRIARATEEFAHVADDILAHHERWDGTGYPQGLQGKNIPLLARITAIADAYEVMANGRPYKAALNIMEIIAEFEKFSASQFDPEITEIALFVLREKLG
jgi:diguanylate cyclase (GGDEF)-like protein/PAS domain S-box-containing protein